MKRKLLRVAMGVVIVLGALVVGLVGYVEASWSEALRFPSTPSPEVRASADPAVIERGRGLVHGAAHCVACHGQYDEDRPEVLRDTDVPLAGGNAIRPPFGVFFASNITSDRETGIGDWSDAEIARVIRTGVRRDGSLSLYMKFAVGPLSDEDLTAVVSYLRSAPPVHHEVPASEPSFVGRALVSFVTIAPDDDDAPAYAPESDLPSIERGRYLARGPAACVGCHSPPSEGDMFAMDEARLFAGGEPMEGHGAGSEGVEYAPPNLTPDPRTGASGRLDEDAFVERMRAIGRTARGSPMPWESYARMPEADLRSIHRYLRTVPAIARDTGPTSRAIGSFTPPP
jgi:mono/diheme cytochrome c family protein